MPRFSANLSTLFGEHDFLDRFAAAAEAGFKAVEFQFPYGFDKSAVAERLAANGLEVVLHNMPPGDADAGDRGMACFPDRIGEFQDSVGKAVDYATAIGCKQLNCLSGIKPDNLDSDLAQRTLIDNLAFSSKALGEAGIRQLIEPINSRDMPGFFLNTSGQAIAIMDAVGSDNLYLQYDFYHMQIMEGDLAATFATLRPRIAHVQFADSPGRHEPGTGEIHYPFLFSWIDRAGYDGWVGAEYHPKTSTSDSLAWFQPYRPNA
ncbi:MAG: hydroxypyruvate isomerase [Pseudomonadota bacterium]